MTLELYIIIGISGLTLIFLVLFILSKIQLHRLNKQYIDNNKQYLRVKSKLSMIESYNRNYKEGKNPFTVLRDISNTLYEEDTDE